MVQSGGPVKLPYGTDAPLKAEPPRAAPPAPGLAPLYCPVCRHRLYDYEPTIPSGRVGVRCQGRDCGLRWVVQVGAGGRLRLEELGDAPGAPAPG